MRVFLTFATGIVLGAALMFYVLWSGLLSGRVSADPGSPTTTSEPPKTAPAPGDFAQKTGADARKTDAFGKSREVTTGSPEPPPRTGSPSSQLDGASEPPVVVTDEQNLKERKIGLPLKDYPREQLHDNFNEKRGGDRPHEAVDLLAPRGTAVFAVDDGRVAKLFTSKHGGLTVYQFDSTITYSYYYAHLDRYADKMMEGAAIRKGDVIGYVGTTGNASDKTPHLHFAIFRLGPERNWWQGVPVNPYPILLQAISSK